MGYMINKLVYIVSIMLSIIKRAYNKLKFSLSIFKFQKNIR